MSVKFICNKLTFWCFEPLKWAAYESAPVQEISQRSQWKTLVAGFDEGLPTVVGVNLEFASRFLCFWPSRCSL